MKRLTGSILLLVVLTAPAYAATETPRETMEKFFPVDSLRPAGPRLHSIKPQARFFPLGQRAPSAKIVATIPAKSGGALVPKKPPVKSDPKAASSLNDERARQLLSIFQASD